jgi:hypothetical protein
MANTARVKLPNLEWSKLSRKIPFLGRNSFKIIFSSRSGNRYSVTVRLILVSPVQRLELILRPLAFRELKARVAKASIPVKNLG